MKDHKGKELTDGQTAKRVVSISVMDVSSKRNLYAIRSRLWHEGDAEPSLVADAGFVTELLTPERAKEFEIIEGAS